MILNDAYTCGHTVYWCMDVQAYDRHVNDKNSVYKIACDRIKKHELKTSSEVLSIGQSDDIEMTGTDHKNIVMIYIDELCRSISDKVVTNNNE